MARIWRAAARLPAAGGTHGAAATGTSRRGAAGARCGGGGRELAGLPEADEAFEAGQNAQEAGADQGMQRGANAWCGGGGVGAQIGRDDGEVVGQGSGCNF